MAGTHRARRFTHSGQKFSVFTGGMNLAQQTPPLHVLTPSAAFDPSTQVVAHDVPLTDGFAMWDIPVDWAAGDYWVAFVRAGTSTILASAPP